MREAFPDLPLHRFFQPPQPCQNEQLFHSGFAPGGCQTGDPLHNPAYRFTIVAQVRQDCNYIIADFLALQKPVTVEVAYVNRVAGRNCISRRLRALRQ